MSNRIRNVIIYPRALSPVEAELLVRVEADSPGEVRGRIVGPMCIYATTIEVAYPLRPLPGPASLSPMTRRVVIPEPSLWSPKTPFLYRGAIELLDNDAPVDRREIITGLRSLKLLPDGLRWNGKRLELSAVEKHDVDEIEFASLRARGVNTLIVDWPAWELLSAAERIGFAILARPSSIEDVTPNSPAFVAWILPSNWRRRSEEWQAWLPRAGRYVGAQYDGDELPPGIHFTIGGPDGDDRPRLL